MGIATAAVAATGGLGWMTHGNVAGAEEVSPFDMPNLSPPVAVGL